MPLTCGWHGAQRVTSVRARGRVRFLSQTVTHQLSALLIPPNRDTVRCLSLRQFLLWGFCKPAPLFISNHIICLILSVQALYAAAMLALLSISAVNRLRRHSLQAWRTARELMKVHNQSHAAILPISIHRINRNKCTFSPKRTEYMTHFWKESASPSTCHQNQTVALRRITLISWTLREQRGIIVPGRGESLASVSFTESQPVTWQESRPRALFDI